MRKTVKREPGKIRAGALALTVHVLFFILLLVGVSWRSRPVAPVEVDLWSSIPTPQVAPKVAEPQPEPPKPAPPPEPEPKPEPKPAPEPKAEPEPEPAPPPKVDIELKQKQEKLKREQEEKQRLAEEKRKKEEQRKKEEEQKKLAEQQKQKEEQRKKLAEEQAKKEAAKKEQAAREAADKAAKAAAAAKVSDYLSKIAAAIRRNTNIPPDLTGNPEVAYEVTLLPTGEVLNIRLIKSSGFPSYDAATERAILKSSPLPIPKDDPVLFQSQFRVGIYRFRPND